MIRAEKLKTIFQILASNQIHLFVKAFVHRVYSNSRAIGLRRDLEEPFSTPDAKCVIHIRKLEQREADVLLDTNTVGIDEEGVHTRLSRSQLLRIDIPQCYVAETEVRTPCYMQWLFSPQENQALKKYYRGYFPELMRDEALLEGAFTSENFRGQRIMANAMSQIASKAADFGARWVITFVDEENGPSLKACQRAGFSPYMLREERWRLFHRFVKFYEVTDSVRGHFAAVRKPAGATAGAQN